MAEEALEQEFAEPENVEDLEEVGAEEEPVPEESDGAEEAAAEESQEKEEKAAAEPSDVEKLKEESRRLRRMLRSMREELALQKASHTQAPQEEVDELDQDLYEEETPKSKPQPSRLQQIHQALNYVGQQRGAQLQTLAATMELSPQYSDLRQVCSQDNIDDILDQATENIVKAQGGDYDEVRAELTLNLWSQDNPYAYMYDLIKQYHPDYSKVEQTPKPQAEAKEVPTTVGALKGGRGSDQVGWTAKKIESMDEDDLHKIPDDVYEAYWRGDLK